MKEDENCIYMTFDKWMDVLEEYPGIKGLQTGNSELYIFTVDGSQNIWLQDVGSDEPRQSGNGTIERWKKERGRENDDYDYWFEPEELAKYEVYVKFDNLEDIINGIE